MMRIPNRDVHRSCGELVWREILPSLSQSLEAWRNNLFTRGKHVVSFQNYQKYAGLLQRAIPRRKICLYLHTYLSWRTDWIPFVQQEFCKFTHIILHLINYLMHATYYSMYSIILMVCRKPSLIRHCENSQNPSWMI